MKKLALLLLLAVPAVAQITDYESCQQKACYGFRPPTGGSQNGMLWHDLSVTPARLWCGQNGTWQLCGSSASGTINSIQQGYLAIQPNPGLGSVLGQPTTAINGLVPMLNGIKNAQLFCNVLGTLDGTCFGNSIAANSTIWVPAGNYTITNTINITQSGVTIQCQPGAVFLQGSTNTAINITGNNVTFDGCTLNANGQSVGSGSTQVVEVNGSTNFTFRNGTLISTVSTNQILRTDSVTNTTITHNTCQVSNTNNQSASCATQFGTSGQIEITYNKGSGQFGVVSPAPGGNTTSVVFAGNDLQTVPGSGAGTFVLGDFSTSHNSPLKNIVIANNVCHVAGSTSSALHVFGCWSIVGGEPANCTVSGNSFLADPGSFIDTTLLEFGLDNCAVSNNSFQSFDSNNLSYDAIVSYGGNNTFIGNTIQGWGKTGFALVKYPEGAVPGSPHVSDNDIIANNTLVGVNGENYATGIVCNTPSVTAQGTKFIGNRITGTGATFFQGIRLTQDNANCHFSATVAENHIQNAADGIHVYGADNLWVGHNDFQNVTNHLANAGSSTINNTEFNTNVAALNFIPTGLTPSIQGLCYPTAGQPLTTSGCAPINQGVVTFTPTAAGWYRIISGGWVGMDIGSVEIYTNSASGQQSTKDVAFSLSFYSQNSLILTNLSQTNSYGIVDMIRGSSNGTNAVYLDIHVNSSFASVGPITLTFTGLGVNTHDIVAAPVVGATAGSSGVVTLDTTSYPLNPNVPVSMAESGVHKADTFDAAGQGFQYHEAAPLNHVLLGNGTYYQDAAIPVQAVSANLTTTSATSDSVTITGIGTGSHCSFGAGNPSAATNIATAYVSNYATNSVTLTHAATAGMNYILVCTIN